MKIIIRRAKIGDENGIAEMFREGLKKKNFAYTGTNKPFSKEKIKKIRKSFSEKNHKNYTFVAMDKNKLIGSVSFEFKKKGRTRHRADFGWGIHPDYQGKGIGSKLLKTALDFAKKKGFKRADAEAAIENKASWKLAKKCGFKIEGIKKKGLLTDDKRYIDNYILGKILSR